MNGVTEVTERYLRLYRENIDKVSGTSTEYINSFRNDAFEKFVSLGIPTKKNEAYKYTNLNTFFDQDYNTYFIPEKSDFIRAEEFRCDIAELDTYGLVLINGFYPSLNGRLQQLPGGVWVGSLNDACVRFPDLIRQHYGKYAESNNDGLIHLNTAMASDGIFIYVPENTILSKPFQIVNLISSEKDMFNQHR